MKRGYLKSYFKGVAVKELSVVETDELRSNQHEFNGDRGLKELLGTEGGRKIYQTMFMYMDGYEVITANGAMTWYDAREHDLKRTEWRLYFPTTEVSRRATAGDTLFICLKPSDEVLVIIAEQESTIESQLCWLFGIEEKLSQGFHMGQELKLLSSEMSFIVGEILGEIGIEAEVESDANDYLSDMLDRFGGLFPTTKEFSEYARSTFQELDPVSEPDVTLLKWVNREEELFKILEKHIIAERLRKGFSTSIEVDVEGFIHFSLSVQNRRKSRVGQAFENHIEELFKANKILYTRTPMTENRAKPDFIFPCIEAYKSESYPMDMLTMLGVKSTCKDRWRQVLAEADRIEKKHLLTLEPAISENQTTEMKVKNLQLVLPIELHESYSTKQKEWLWSLKDFICEVKDKQAFFSVDRIR